MDVYIVDTSALIKDPELLDKLRQCRIVIHTIVLEELDVLSKRNTERGALARRVGDRLFEIRSRGNFVKGIKVDHKIICFDDTKPDPDTYLRFGFNPEKADNLLLCVANELRAKTGERVVLLTSDNFFLLKANMDIEVEYIKGPRDIGKKKSYTKGFCNNGHQMPARKRA